MQTLLRRGDLVTIALQGDLGKPRPAVVIQSDLFDVHPSVTVLPLTSLLHDAPLVRIAVHPGAANGLRDESQVMVDKPSTVMRERLGPVFGRVDDETMLAVNRALAVRQLSRRSANVSQETVPARLGDIVGTSPPIQMLVKEIGKISAASHATVLIERAMGS